MFAGSRTQPVGASSSVKAVSAPNPASALVSGNQNPIDATHSYLSMDDHDYFTGKPAATLLSNFPKSIEQPEPSYNIANTGGDSLSVLYPSTPLFLSVGTQVATADSKGFALGNAHILPGENALSVDGTRMSLDHSGGVIVDQSTFTLPPTEPAIAGANSFTIAGQTSMTNTRASLIAGTAVSKGGPAMTVGGISISLQTSGALVLGTSTVELPKIQGQGLVSRMDGFSIQVQSSFAIGDGNTLSPGGPAVKVPGSALSQELGALTTDAGSARLPHPKSSSNATAGLQVVDSGQGRRVEFSILWLSVAFVFFQLI